MVIGDLKLVVKSCHLRPLIQKQKPDKFVRHLFFAISRYRWLACGLIFKRSVFSCLSPHSVDHRMAHQSALDFDTVASLKSYVASEAKSIFVQPPKNSDLYLDA